MRILVTGSEGLVGSALTAALRDLQHQVVGLDLLGDGHDRGDVRRADDVARAVHGCDGVVHLAAISRVVWGERDPDACVATNLGGTRNVLAACLEASPRWVLFASSREVYGQPAALPASEDAPRHPVNVYGRSKVQGEDLVVGAREHGLATAVVRLSNVYGTTDDHQDRVVPAFARGAAEGRELRVDGRGHTFDFTHLDDTVDGLVRMIGLLEDGEAPPPVHVLTGRPTTLGELAELAVPWV